MNKSDFTRLLNEVSYRTQQFTQEFVVDELGSIFLYKVILNQSLDDPTDPDFTYYPKDEAVQHTNLEQEEVVQLLCRNSKLPVWIDISVLHANRDKTVFQLLCAGRYTEDPTKLYYYKRKTGPFAIKSPDLPPNHQRGKKFKLP